MKQTTKNLCGRRIRLARLTHTPPLTQKQLSQKMADKGCSMSSRTISRIETGKRELWDFELLAFSRALGVSLAWLCKDFADDEHTYA